MLRGISAVPVLGGIGWRPWWVPSQIQPWCDLRLVGLYLGGTCPSLNEVVCWVRMAEVNAFLVLILQWLIHTCLMLYTPSNPSEIAGKILGILVTPNTTVSWYHTDLIICLSSQLQVQRGGILEVGDRDTKPETLRGTEVPSSQQLARNDQPSAFELRSWRR